MSADNLASKGGPTGWQEGDSETFIQMGRVMTPRRDEIRETILSLIPARTDEAFTAVDLAGGAGWLSEAILERFPASRVTMFDGSATMRAEAEHSLQRFEDRFRTEPFRLEDDVWMQRLGGPVRCFVSSLAVHHLDDAGKRALFIALLDRLEAGGAVLIADVVQPASEPARELAARSWSAEVRRQSIEIIGNTEMSDFFEREHWNIFDYPDPIDMPSRLSDQLEWFRDAGYMGEDVFWAYAGHAVYGAYRPARRRTIASR